MRPEEPMFQPLDDPPARWQRFAPSLVGHTLLVAAVIAIPISVVRVQSEPQKSVVALVDPRPLKLPPIQRRVIEEPKRQVRKLAIPVRPIIAPPAPVRVARVAPPVPAKIEAAPAPVIAAVAVNGPVMPAPVPLAPLVRTGGFGDAASGGASGGGGVSGTANVRKVAMGGFGDVKPIAAASMERRPVVEATPVQTPVEITFKPRPAYTEQARTQHLEGEVQLEVVFCASGTVEVLRVVKSLGFGLDDSARTAASHIRFHPATRGGAPIDVRGIVHIAFELS